MSVEAVEEAEGGLMAILIDGHLRIALVPHLTVLQISVAYGNILALGKLSTGRGAAW